MFYFYNIEVNPLSKIYKYSIKYLASIFGSNTVIKINKK